MSAASFVTEDGCALAYEDVGAGLPVVWQHGLGADRTQPAEVFPDITGVRRIMLECRGHGDSELGDPALLSIAQFANDVVALLDHLKIEKAVLGGISLGAAISMRLAATAPSRVTGLILARPAWVDAAAPSTMKPYIAVAELLERFGREEGMREFSGSSIYSEVSKLSPDNAASLASFFSRPNELSTIELLSRIAKDGPGLTREQIASIAAPTLIIGTEEEFVHPLIYASSLKDWIPRSTLLTITSKTVNKALYKSEFREALAAFLAERLASR